MSIATRTIVSRTIAASTVAVVATLALVGCAGGDDAPGDRRSAASTTKSTASPSPKSTPTASAEAEAEAAATPTNLTFEDGAAISPSSLPAFGLEVSALGSWTQSGEDPTTGSREYTNADGAVATITQQKVTDLDPNAGDRAATERMFTAAGYPADRLEEQLLPTMSGGTAQFLSIATQNTDGTWSATVVRAFAKPGAALIVKVQTPSQEALRPDLHDILVHAQVILT
ncbi:hypothetical protein [Curtobacterium sp. 9128]|uniref:hypothetical protein n=1 Tax=Curtobacterium sp. 9128 TaxID=1793722 RepID=UPI0011A3BD21|nr:hypothetical protein [Curtobacterium sp. 9128]